MVASAPAANGAVSLPWNTAALADGVHTVQLQAADAAGNLGTSTLCK